MFEVTVSKGDTGFSDFFDTLESAFSFAYDYAVAGYTVFGVNMEDSTTFFEARACDEGDAA
jgi:hypothetical protein